MKKNFNNEGGLLSFSMKSLFSERKKRSKSNIKITDKNIIFEIEKQRFLTKINPTN